MMRRFVRGLMVVLMLLVLAVLGSYLGHVFLGFFLQKVVQSSRRAPAASDGMDLPRRASHTIRAGPDSLYPIGQETRGSTNPDVTQDNIEETICNPNWHTIAIRPSSSYTRKLKQQQIDALGLPGTSADYEEDHLIPLELPTDPDNLWPEAYEPKPGAHQKDGVERYLHNEVCTGNLSLRDAQREISEDWYEVYLQIHPSAKNSAKN
jgi:hypothetical protein